MFDERINHGSAWWLWGPASLALHLAALFVPMDVQPARVNYTRGISALRLTLQPAPCPSEIKSRAHAEHAALATESADTAFFTSAAVMAAAPAIANNPPRAAGPLPAIPPTTAAADLDHKGVDLPARANTPIRPVYPGKSRQMGETGKVDLCFNVTPAGRASDIKIVKSSGFKRLDAAAVTAIQNAGFMPAQYMGRSVPSALTVTFLFRLEDRDDFRGTKPRK